MEFQTQMLREQFKKTYPSMTEEIQQCVELCLECHRICEQILPYCLEMGGRHSSRKHILSLVTCADICRTSAHFMMWGSDLHPMVCSICAEACSKCAESCERFEDDGAMKVCAEICRKCSLSCHQMATQH